MAGKSNANVGIQETMIFGDTRLSDGGVRKAHVRREVTRKVRQTIFERDGCICQLCGSDVQPQCDHKKPVVRGGESDIENLQTLCQQCNIKKQQVCRRCELSSCDLCPLAYPERFANVLVVGLPIGSATKLNDVAIREGVTPADLVLRLIAEEDTAIAGQDAATRAADELADRWTAMMVP